MPDFDKYDVYYLDRKIEDIFDSNYSYGMGLCKITLFFINDEGHFEIVSEDSDSFKFVKKEIENN